MATLLEINDALAYLTAAYPTQEISKATMAVYEDMFLDVDVAAMWLAVRDYLDAGHTGLPWGPGMLRGMAMKRQQTGSVLIYRSEKEWLERKALDCEFLLTNVVVIGEGKAYYLLEGPPPVEALLANGSNKAVEPGPLHQEWQLFLDLQPHYKKVLESAKVIEWDGETAVIQVPNNMKAYFELRLQARVEEALSVIMEQKVVVQFVSPELEGIKA